MGGRARGGLAFGLPAVVAVLAAVVAALGAWFLAREWKIAAAKAMRATVVLITHRLTTLAAADKLLMLRGGIVELFGPASEVLSALMRPVQPDAADAAPPLAAVTMRTAGSNEFLKATGP